MQSLKGKVALITGASSGIGAGIAGYFSKQGAKLSLAGRKQDNLNNVAAQTKLSENDILTTTGDMITSEDRSILIQRTIEKFGKLDILINNAGVCNFSLLEDVTEEHYDTLFDTNVKSHILLTKLAIPHLVKSKGNIVNISSAGSEMMVKTEAIYCMTKAALDFYTKTLAAELGPKGVRVNSVNPGFIPDTRILERSNLFEIQETDWEQFHSAVTEAAPLRKAGTPEDVAKATAFLASDHSSFTTGEILMIDGGIRFTNFM